MKYNAVLRGILHAMGDNHAAPSARQGQSEHMRGTFERLCGPANEKGRFNTYTTTVHCINSCVVKLSKLTRAGPVWRGMHSGLLPDQLWERNEFGLRCGVELGLMSITRDKEVATHYAELGQAAMVFSAEVRRGGESNKTRSPESVLLMLHV